MNENQLENLLSKPYPEDIEAVAKYKGDLIVLGAGGKMGPTLVQRAVRAFREAGRSDSVYAVSRFSDSRTAHRLEQEGAAVISADLLDEESLFSLPECPHVIYMAGVKFGTSGNEAMTWTMNSYLPGRIAQKFKESSIIAFSTGNVYPLVSIDSRGSLESDPTEPVGEYAQSCLGRERVFTYFSKRYDLPALLLRLNYAVEPRYGVLLDIGKKVFEEKPVSVQMGYVNVVWQGDANSVTLRAFPQASVPAKILNVTGPETLSVREIARKFGNLFDREPILVDTEAPTALLSDASRCHELFGQPRFSIDQVLELVAAWIEEGGRTLSKPTKFEVRNGKF